ncbi:MAG: hypothetical protein KC438_00505 [Thermomicrobiales bacterium]|nr:hypothetical protein [Thermomicrobiales bacterium]MCO5220217.1 hypothetical protein [Thermomicrobiales bacterium]
MRKIATILTTMLMLGMLPAFVLAQPPGKPTAPASTPVIAGPPITLPAGDASPSPTIEERLDLAAMALDSTVAPEGYTLFYELYIRGDQVSTMLTGGAITEDEIASSGLQWYYESVYISADGSTRLRSYVQQYADIDGAIRGFELLEDEDRLAPEGSVFTDGPGAGVGEEPAEISEGSLQPSGPAPVVNSIDSTFRTGNLLAGVSIDTLPGQEADRAQVVSLTSVLYDRIQLVLQHQAIDLIDPVLPGQMVTLGPTFQSHDEGYLSAAEIVGPAAAAPIEPAFISGYFTNQSLASDLVALPIPLVSLTVARFQDPAAALQLLNDAAAVLHPPFDGVQPLDIAPIPGSSVTQAFTYANPMLSGAERDSVRIVMIAGNDLVILDLQANKTLDGAQAAAIEIATAQLACLQSPDPCPPLELTPGLLEPPEMETGAPVATPPPVG